MLKEQYSTWHCGSHVLELTRPRIMGILNVTPDSFSDGNLVTEGQVDVAAAVERALKMLDEGADIIDVGGESTRLGHTPVTPDEEAHRIVPVIRGILAAAPTAIISVDTRHAQVAKMCLRLGASIINDVSGFTDPAMVEVAAHANCGCLVMHWQQAGLGSHVPRRQVELDKHIPRPSTLLSAQKTARFSAAEKPARTSQRRFTLPDQAPIMRQVMGFLGDQARVLMRAGVAHDRIALDPGPGFDKFYDEDVVIQRCNQNMVSMGYPLVAAVSRKRFVGAVSGVDKAPARDSATMGICLAAIQNGARIVRVHNVAAAAEAINSFWAVTQKDARQGFISLGSSVGERLNYLSRALQLIDDIPLTCVVAVSHAYESEGAYGLDGTVANAVAEIRTELHPLVLLGHMQQIEAELGRVRTPGATHPEARTIDLDLCFIEGEVHAGKQLTLPHPGLGERDYVLFPLEDLMHDPTRYLSHAGITVLPREERLGQVIGELGTLDWD